MQAQELIEQAYRKGYKAGIEDGRKIATTNTNGKLTPKEMVNFLIDQFDVTESTARDMWHKLKQLQSWDDYKKGIKEN